MTPTRVSAEASPPGPLQSRRNTYVPLIKVGVGDPPSGVEVGFGPVQSPDAVHESVPSDCQDKVVEDPVITSDFAGANPLIVGMGNTASGRSMNWVPPGPLQVNLNSLFPWLRPESVSLPDSGLDPLQGAPLASQDSAYSEDQISSTESLGSMKFALNSNSMNGGGKTSMEIVFVISPFTPTQVSSKSLISRERTPVSKVPAVPRESPHAPLATQLVASVVFHRNKVPLLFCPNLVEPAVNCKVGGGKTGNFTSAEMLPPPPWQVSLNVLVPFVSPDRTSSPPSGSLLPVNGAPVAEQLFASVTDQKIFTLSPGATTSLDNSRVMTGAGTTSTVTSLDTSPFKPVHCRPYSLKSLVSTPVSNVPEGSFAPLQAPLAVHAVASVAFHFNCVPVLVCGS